MQLQLAKQSVIPLPSISLVEWLQMCCNGRLPGVVSQAINEGGYLAHLVKFAQLIGGLEPLCASRPGVCDPVVVVDKDITVPPATLNQDGTITPNERRVISYCAPMNRALIIQRSRTTAANLTAAEQPITQPIMKRVNLATFPDGWCLSFEPPDMAGQFSNVEHIVVPPQAGYSIFVQNFNPNSEAVYHHHARMWACC